MSLLVQSSRAQDKWNPLKKTLKYSWFGAQWRGGVYASFNWDLYSDHSDDVFFAFCGFFIFLVAERIPEFQFSGTRRTQKPAFGGIHSTTNFNSLCVVVFYFGFFHTICPTNGPNNTCKLHKPLHKHGSLSFWPTNCCPEQSFFEVYICGWFWVVFLVFCPNSVKRKIFVWKSRLNRQHCRMREKGSMLLSAVY